LIPEIYARALLDQLGVRGVPDVQAIASSLGVSIMERPLEGCDGLLVRIKGSLKGAIAVKDSIREEGRKRFTIAHELGHLVLPGHEDQGICAGVEIESWSGQLAAKEQQANAFAAELLMPADLVQKVVPGLAPSLAGVLTLSRQCQTSLTASGYRLVTLTSYAAALVWSQAGEIRWPKKSEEFKQWIRSGRLDPRTFAADLVKGQPIPAGPQPVPVEAWLEVSAPDSQLLEESLVLPNYDAVLTLLWIRDPLPEPDELDELLNPLDPNEFSLKRSRWRK